MTGKATVPAQVAPPPYEAADITAIQLLQQGECPPHLQKRALDWVIMHAAGTYNLSFAPGDDRLTSFHEGRRFVGLQLVKMLKLNAASFKKEG